MPSRIYDSSYPAMPLMKNSIFHHAFPEQDTESAQLPQAKLAAHLPAFVDAPTGRVLTRGQLRSNALRMSLGLKGHSALGKQLGLARGDVVMLFSLNSIDYPVVFFGAQAAGLITTLANSGYTPPEVAHQLRDSGARVVFVLPALLDTLQKAIAILKKEGRAVPKVVLAVRDVDVPPEAKHAGLQSYEALYASEQDVQRQKWTGERFTGEQVRTAAVLCYSSGTTGLSKGVESTHFNMTSIQTMLSHPGPYQILSPEQGDKIVGVLPFYHIYGLAKLLLHPLTQGVPVITHPRFEPEAFLSSIEKYKITWGLIVPPILVIMATSPLVEKYDLSSLKGVISGAAPLGEGLLRRVVARMHKGFFITQGYGLTETSPTSHYMPLDEAPQHVGSCGKLVPHLQARLVDVDGNDVEEGQPGELWLRGPSIMKGYWHNAEATKNTMHGDWFKTGDIAQRDKDGYYFIVDRLKELIKYKGFQVPPADLEALLMTHTKIADAGVCGVNSEEQATELPRAYVVPVGGIEKMSEADKRAFSVEIQKWVAGQVANHKQLRGGVILVDAIPKSPAGKILRRELRTRAAAERKEEEAKAKRSAKL